MSNKNKHELTQKQRLLIPSKEFKKKRRRKRIHKIISNISFGLVNKTSELVLLFIIFNEELIGAGGSHGKFAINLGNRLMDDYPEVDARQWFEGVRNIRRKRWIDGSGAITREGKERLRFLFPRFYPEKHWDSSWYVVNFDIPESLSRKRDILRDKLKNLGFGMLQKSIWLSPVNFLGIVQGEATRLEISPYVLCLETKNLEIEDSKMLANRVWGLEDLNRRYEEFILKYEKGITKNKLPSVFMELASILKDDPQLPIELLPQNWLGREAYGLVGDFYSDGKLKKEYKELLLGS